MAKLLLNGRRVEAPVGSLLSDVISSCCRLEMPCSGSGRCGKCRVTAEGALSQPSAEERQHLTGQELAAGIRLACCTRVEGDCTVSLQEAAPRQIQLSGQLPGFTPDPLFSRYGVAVDIGTTTLAACLYTPDGCLLAQAGASNPQAHWGSDVISRIQASLQGQGEALAKAIRAGISGLIEELASQAQILPSAIDALVLTGNTAMLYLLTGASPACLSRAPFEADCLFGEMLPASALGLPCPAAGIYLPRCISAFVGADITTALLASGLFRCPDTALLVDIGTNAEAVLWHNGRMLCCSAAAGPAFEGAGLSMGMGGRPGAVDHVHIQSGRLSPHILGGGPPIGICGSGVVDALACLLELEALDETGYLSADSAPVAPPVELTQQDIRMVQLAKSAVYAGMQALLQRQGLQWENISGLFIAGGFGSYLNIRSAERIGLLPAGLEGRIHILGNAALAGASMLLLNRRLLPQSENLAACAQTADLSTDPVFMEAYVEGMSF